jgi:hypothetical protein
MMCTSLVDAHVHLPPYSPDSTLRYGVSPDARVESGGAIFSWALEQVVDRFGNRIAYAYVM